MGKPGPPGVYTMKKKWASFLTGSTLLSSAFVATAAAPIPSWVTSAPPAATQISKTPAERGVNACAATPITKNGYRDWRSLGHGAWLAIPKRPRKGGTYDILFHFHGKDAAFRQLAHRDNGIVLVGVDVGVGSGAYLDLFADPTYFRRLLLQIDQKVTETDGFEEKRRGRVALSSWSAGYGATMKILASPMRRQKIDAVILLDGLHTSYDGANLSTAKLDPFAQYAKLASKGERLMVIGHSSIIPPGYASTTMTSNYLVWQAGGKPKPPSSSRSYPLGLELNSQYSSGSFHVRGFVGNGKQDHCAQFGVLGSLAAPLLEERWGLKR